MPSNLKTDDKGNVKKGPGRPKGSQNKINKAAKDAIADAAEALGGSARLVDWVKEDPLNERAFWSTIYPKLIPHEVSGPDGGPLQIQEVVRKIVDANND